MSSIWQSFTWLCSMENYMIIWKCLFVIGQTDWTNDRTNKMTRIGCIQNYEYCYNWYDLHVKNIAVMYVLHIPIEFIMLFKAVTLHRNLQYISLNFCKHFEIERECSVSYSMILRCKFGISWISCYWNLEKVHNKGSPLFIKSSLHPLYLYLSLYHVLNFKQLHFENVLHYKEVKGKQTPKQRSK